MNLLSAVYGLPKVGLVCPFNYQQAQDLGDRWITFHHFTPETELLDWINEAQPVLLTTIRHPGDVLISLYHHIRGFPSTPMDPLAVADMLVQPYKRLSIEPPAIHTFREELECSLAWKRTGLTRIVRYEDLRLNPVDTLTSLASRIQPVDQSRILQAIEKCDIDLMRSLNEQHRRFFRSGLVGQWKAGLSLEVLQALGEEPYLSQFAELGYTLDAQNALPALVPQVSPFRNSLREVAEFANGAKVSPIIQDFYLSLDPAVNAKWPAIDGCGPGSFFEWISSSSELAGKGWYAGVFLSRLAHYIYRIRPDLQQAFPDVTGLDRVRYAEWFIRNAGGLDYRLDNYFIQQVTTALVRWGNAQSREEVERLSRGPALTNFALYIYRIRTDIQQIFPVLDASGIARYAEWFVRYAGEHDDHVGRYLVPQIKYELVRWGNTRSREDRERRPWWPNLSNYAVHLYESMPELQRRFPDVLSQDRWNFLQWIITPDHGMRIFPELTESIRIDLERCARFRRAIRCFLRLSLRR